MTEESNYTEQECHKKFAVDLFNLVWSLLGKKDRTKQEDDKMVHAAHASRFHWGEIGTSLEIERGEWQISRVFSVLHRTQSALYHAKRCLEICTSPSNARSSRRSRRERSSSTARWRARTSRASAGSSSQPARVLWPAGVRAVHRSSNSEPSPKRSRSSA